MASGLMAIGAEADDGGTRSFRSLEEKGRGLKPRSSLGSETCR